VEEEIRLVPLSDRLHAFVRLVSDAVVDELKVDGRPKIDNEIFS
jgi:hypothetical protein